MSDFEQRAREAAKYCNSSAPSAIFMEGADFGYMEGHVAAERELREPMACGHLKAEEYMAIPGSESSEIPKLCCWGCRREQGLREALRDLHRLLDSSSDPVHPDRHVEMLERAAALLASPKEAKHA